MVDERGEEVWKPTEEQIRAARGKSVPDIIAPGLRVLFVGINPGLYTAAIGHHFGRPGNRFWPALHFSGFTPCLFSPFEERKLIDLGLGITNLVNTATVSADEVGRKDLYQGGSALKAKIIRYRPRCTAILGIGGFRIAFGKPRVSMGRQPDPIGESIIWILPNPSGLNANYTLPKLVEMLKELKRAVEPSN